MNKKLFVIVSAIFVLIACLGLSALAYPGIAEAKQEKVTICHVPPGNPGNPQTITVAKAAWDNGHSPHKQHSLDYLGKCQTPEPTATLEPTPTLKVTTTPAPTATATNPPPVTVTPPPTATQPPPAETPPTEVPTKEPQAEACPAGDCVYVDFVVDEESDMEWVFESLTALEEAGYTCPDCVLIRVVYDEAADIEWVPDALRELEAAGYSCEITN